MHNDSIQRFCIDLFAFIWCYMYFMSSEEATLDLFLGNCKINMAYNCGRFLSIILNIHRFSFYPQTIMFGYGTFSWSFLGSHTLSRKFLFIIQTSFNAVYLFSDCWTLFFVYIMKNNYFTIRYILLVQDVLGFLMVGFLPLSVNIN